MESLTSGTMAGNGSFRCQQCGYVLTLAAADALFDCPGCGGRSFVRASLFSTGRFARNAAGAPEPDDHGAWLERTRARVTEPGAYLAYRDLEDTVVVALTREWTRVGRSLAADVRFDDPTVSRRHALVVRHDDGVRVLDDRSLNGVFVNGERVEGSALSDGDEIVIGRFRLYFLAPTSVSGVIAPDASPVSG